MSISFSSILTQDYLREFQRNKLSTGEDVVTCGRWGYKPHEVIYVSDTVLLIDGDVAVSAGDYCLYRGLQVEYLTVASATNLGDPWSSGFGDGFGPVVRQLTLAAPLVEDWSLGGTLVLSVIGRLGTQSSFEAISDSVATADLTLDLEQGENEHPYLTDEIGKLDGVEILSLRPDWSVLQKHAIEYPYEVVDYSIGVIKTFAPVDRINRIVSATYTTTNRLDSDKLVGLFGRMKGRWGEFYCPTWLNDMAPRTRIRAGDRSIYVQTPFVFNDTVHRAVYVILKDGRGFAAKITGVENPPDDELGPGEFTTEFASTFDIGTIGGK